MILRILIALIISIVAYVTYYNNAISTDYNEDIACFDLNDSHINTLRNSAVTFDTTEGGAPMLSFELKDLLFPGKISANESLDTTNRAIIKGIAFQIFLNAATLKSGNYSFTNPLFDDDNHNSRISSIPKLLELYDNKTIGFYFNENHATLLKSSKASFSYGVIGINAKRPFGDSTAFEYDIADIVGEKYPVNNDNTGNMSAEMLDRIMRLYYELVPALQVLLINGEIETGKYCRENSNSEWIKF
ncbi:hypothetical protein GCM10009133_09150 [Cocleimonas flava]|uniref:Uncharacterized protein n=1 Tax=Cocleimonas flava TaxID=634765 RepID=A0A4R1EZF8_9GAMM|nr:hypothetical protein [Cocleimonas flava]TCJ87277.1 hypothetical protein EV695_1785 [Cocleimonas flava]